MDDTDYSGHSARVHQILARDHVSSEFLTKLGFVDTGDETAINLFIQATRSSPTTVPKVQRKVYLGTLKQPVTVDTLRCIVVITAWAKQLNMNVAFEHDGRMYLTNVWWHYKDPNQLPWDWVSMTFDLLSDGLE